MKVVEKDTDREAEMHLYVQGSSDTINPLDEYGEYVDTVDKAICCSVPVTVGDELKVEGRFKGTTQTVQADILVDGICRKTFVWKGTAVKKDLKGKKISCDKALFRTNDDVVESKMITKGILSDNVVVGDSDASIGTIEVRLSVLRRWGDEHRRQGPSYYDDASRNEGDKTHDDSTEILPELFVTHEEDVQALDEGKAWKFKREMDNMKPGTEPWAIFRFHYRSKASILEKDLKKSFSHSLARKAVTAQELQIEKLPGLTAGEKQPGQSTRQTSLTPSMAGTVASARRDTTEPPSTQTTGSNIPIRSIERDTPASDTTITDTMHGDQTNGSAVPRPFAVPEPKQEKDQVMESDSLFVPEKGDNYEEELFPGDMFSCNKEITAIKKVDSQPAEKETQVEEAKEAEELDVASAEAVVPPTDTADIAMAEAEPAAVAEGDLHTPVTPSKEVRATLLQELSTISTTPAREIAPEQEPVTPTTKRRMLSPPASSSIKRLKLARASSAEEHRRLMEKRRQIAELRRQREAVKKQREEIQAKALAKRSKLAKEREELEKALQAEMEAFEQEKVELAAEMEDLELME